MTMELSSFEMANIELIEKTIDCVIVASSHPSSSSGVFLSLRNPETPRTKHVYMVVRNPDTPRGITNDLHKWLQNQGITYIDVLLSFGGPDTRRGITNDLYVELENIGMRTCMDVLLGSRGPDTHMCFTNNLCDELQYRGIRTYMDVHLSFMGPDTCRSITNHSYVELQNSGIRICMDMCLSSGGPNTRRGITNNLCVELQYRGITTYMDVLLSFRGLTGRTITNDSYVELQNRGIRTCMDAYDLASSNESRPPRTKKHDVFLSFRGPDTRRGITNDLYVELQNRGIRTYMDAHDLVVGSPISPSLLTAIEESKFAIVILSPNYATSRWCLEELTKIVQCMDNRILLVFMVWNHLIYDIKKRVMKKSSWSTKTIPGTA